LRTPFAFGLFVACDADDKLGVVQRQIVEALVEVLAVSMRLRPASLAVALMAKGVADPD
jgi:hypothetical protein